MTTCRSSCSSWILSVSTWVPMQSSFVSAISALPRFQRAEASKVKTQALNPMVELSVLPERVDSKPKEFFCQFDVVILIDQKYDDIVRVDSICRFYKIK